MAVGPAPREDDARASTNERTDGQRNRLDIWAIVRPDRSGFSSFRNVSVRSGAKDKHHQQTHHRAVAPAERIEGRQESPENQGAIRNALLLD